MRPAANFAQIADALGEAFEAEGAPAQARALAEMVARHGMAGELIGALFAEARRRTPSDERIQGFAILIAGALDTLRIDGNGGATEARRQLSQVQEILDREVSGEQIAPSTMMLLARSFAQAQVDPGAPLQQAMMGAMEGQAKGGGAKIAVGEPDAAFDRLVESLGDDPFALYEEIAFSAAAFPPEPRAAMMLALVRSRAEPARQALVGFLLDPDPHFAGVVAAMLVEEAPRRPVASVTVERLARIRPWLSAPRQIGVDAALKALRPHAGAPAAGAKLQQVRFFSTPSDGAGGQSVIALAKYPNGRSFVSLLIKDGVGVADTMVATHLAKADAEGMLATMASEADVMPVSRDYFDRRLAAALGENLAATPPPFGLVQALEALGAGPIAPTSNDAAELFADLLADMAADRVGPYAYIMAQRASAHWQDRLDTLETWFEAGEAVEELLAPLRGKKQRMAALLDDYLPTRRKFWAKRCAWTASALKEAAKKDPMWMEMGLIGRAIASDAPLRDIPLMKLIAERSAEAFSAR